MKAKEERHTWIQQKIRTREAAAKKRKTDQATKQDNQKKRLAAKYVNTQAAIEQYTKELFQPSPPVQVNTARDEDELDDDIGPMIIALQRADELKALKAAEIKCPEEKFDLSECWPNFSMDEDAFAR